MNSKSSKLLLYLVITILAVSQIVMAKDEESNTSEESQVNAVIQETKAVIEETQGIVEESPKDTDKQSALEIGTIVVEEVEVTSAKEYIATTTADSDFQDMIVSYADPYLPVRTGADRKSTTVGKLYPGSYAKILERGDEWTKIESGNVKGYIQNIYVCFDQEAEDLSDQLRGTLATGITIEEERKQQAAANASKNNSSSNNNTASGGSVSASSYEVCLLAAIIDWEANNEPYDGKVAVGTVVLNRVRSERFGNSIQEVLSARGQFGGVTDGNGNWSSRFQDRINKYVNGASTECVKAANEALAGANPLNATYYYFNTRVSSYSQCQQIGNHIFYNY